MCLYKSILRPILFKIDPEKVHNLFLSIGALLGSNPITRTITKLVYGYKNNSRLNVKIENILFKNPIGLAAGFDKNGQLIDIIESVGFGYAEIGSVTARPCFGNKKPRLFRLPLDKSLVVNYGLMNKGAEIMSSKLKNKKLRIPLGINIAKTNDPKIKGDGSINDYFKAYNLLKNYGDYLTINVSCPNAGDGTLFQDPKLLNKLLKKIKTPNKPTFLKISPCLRKDNLDKIIDLCFKYKITGLIVSNLTHNSSSLITPREVINNTKGGLSGLPLKNESNESIKYIYKKSKGKLVIIGVGGIFSAEDAYEKIKYGASMVQLITGMIYEGPSLIKKINKGLIKLLDKDGLNNISEAIGKEIK